MIGKARSEYKLECSGYAGNQPGQSESCLAKVIQAGYVELIGSLHPQSFKGIETPAMAEPGGSQHAEERHKLYEYTWSVGVTGFRPDWQDSLDGFDPIVVQVIFHAADTPYSVQEVAATLKQIPPYRKTRMQKVEGLIDIFSPLAQTAGQVLEAGGLEAPGKIISSIAKMKLNAVPVDNFPWYVKTFSLGMDAGVEWHIPRALIEYTGNRLTGSLGVVFIDCGGTVAKAGGEVALELKAFLRGNHGRELFLSPTDRATSLVIAPT